MSSSGYTGQSYGSGTDDVASNTQGPVDSYPNAGNRKPSKDRANDRGAIGVREAAKRFIPDIINKANRAKGLDEVFEWYEGDDVATSSHVTKKSKTTTAASVTPADKAFLSAITKIFSLDIVVENPTHVLISKINGALLPLGLSQRDRIMLGRRMANNDKLLPYFFSLGDEDRAAFVRLELDDIGTYRSVFGAR